ncbi:MAG: thioesterase family protein [bacterium]
MNYSTFKTEITVRPDDIDMNNHVHYSKYLDYLLFGRYDQMKKDYGMSMEDFIKEGYSWFASSANINYKTALKLSDTAIVKTQVKEIKPAQVDVNFWIIRKEDEKVCCYGNVLYTMISLKSERPVRIPEHIIKKYSV